jgi:hypothetical protein
LVIYRQIKSDSHLTKTQEDTMREPQAAIDPPAEWWGEDEWEEEPEYKEDPSMPLQCLAIKLKHTIMTEGIISIYWNHKGWEVHITEAAFRKAFPIYAIEPFAHGPSKYKLIQQIAGVDVICLTERDEGAW